MNLISDNLLSRGFKQIPHAPTCGRLVLIDSLIAFRAHEIVHESMLAEYK